ncbi:MAG: serine/threonine-protein kinase [Pirellulales bacterium]
MSNKGNSFAQTEILEGGSSLHVAELQAYRQQFGKPRDGSDELFRVGGRLSVNRLLGQGGFCCVFLAIDETNGRRVAIKLLRPDKLNDVESVRRFRREQKSLFKLGDLPGVVSSLDLGNLQADEVNQPYLCMAYVPGRTLRAKLEQWRCLPIRESVRILTEICTTLDLIHSNGYTHRDIKPENLIEDASNSQRICIADLGLAFTMDDIAADVSRGQPIGTFSYFAPERLRDRSSDLSRAIDWFSVGCILYEMLVGERAYPFGTMNNPGPPVAPIVLRGVVPPDLSALAMRLIDLDPSKRPQGTNEVLDVLNRIQPEILQIVEPPHSAWPRVSTAQVGLAIHGAWPLKLRLPVAWMPCADSLTLGLASRRQLSLELYEAVSLSISLVSTFRAELQPVAGSPLGNVDIAEQMVNVNASFPLLSALLTQAINVCAACSAASIGLPRFSSQVIRTREALEGLLTKLQNWVLEQNLTQEGVEVDGRRLLELTSSLETYLSELVWLESGCVEDLLKVADLIMARAFSESVSDRIRA